MKEKVLKISNKGITLVALIITIIVLLILAGVSLSFVINGGILDKSQLAVNEYKNAANDEGNTLNDIDKQLDKQLSIYENDGIDMDKLKEDLETNPEKYKHPDQSNTNGDRAVGTDGNPVNMDLWDGWTIEEDGAHLDSRKIASSTYYIYSNSDIGENGAIKGTVPQYIYSETDGKVYPVVSMKETFYGCHSLKIAPKIPSTVKEMYATFGNCVGLETAPELPSKVENISSTFYNCRALKTAPSTIPDTVTNMRETFESCELLEVAPELPNKVEDISYAFAFCFSLKTAPTKIPDTVIWMGGTFEYCLLLETMPELPSKVQDISYAFRGCSALTGDLVINAENVTYYEECLEDTSTNPGCKLELSGSCPQLNEILATATSENVSLKQ